MDPDTKNKITLALVAAGVSFLTWAALTVRKAIKNFGKTDVEIAQAHLDEALQKQEAAKTTPDGLDDEAAAKAVDAAKTALDHAKRLQAIADAVGDTSK